MDSLTELQERYDDLIELRERYEKVKTSWRQIFVSRETPGRRMFQKTWLSPELFLSRYGKNRRKLATRKDRKSAIVRRTEFA